MLPAPILRRAKDLPVFVTWSIEPEGLPTRSRSWLTSSGVASHLTAPSSRRSPDRPTKSNPEDRQSFDRSGLSRNRSPRSKPSDVPRPFLGRPLLRPALLFPPERVPSRVALEEDRLFRRLFPTGPAKPRGDPTLPVGGDRSFRHPPLPSCRCRPSGGGGDFRPDHLLTMHTRSESRKQKMR